MITKLELTTKDAQRLLDLATLGAKVTTATTGCDLQERIFDNLKPYLQTTIDEDRANMEAFANFLSTLKTDSDS